MIVIYPICFSLLHVLIHIPVFLVWFCALAFKHLGCDTYCCFMSFIKSKCRVLQRLERSKTSILVCVLFVVKLSQMNDLCSTHLLMSYGLFRIFWKFGQKLKTITAHKVKAIKWYKDSIYEEKKGTRERWLDLVKQDRRFEMWHKRKYRCG